MHQEFDPKHMGRLLAQNVRNFTSLQICTWGRCNLSTASSRASTAISLFMSSDWTLWVMWSLAWVLDSYPYTVLVHTVKEKVEDNDSIPFTNILLNPVDENDNSNSIKLALFEIWIINTVIMPGALLLSNTYLTNDCSRARTVGFLVLVFTLNVNECMQM